MAGFVARSFKYTTKVDERKKVQFTTEPAIEPNANRGLTFCFICLFVSHIVLFFVVRWHGGSFAKLGFSVGLCGFANVPPIAWAYSSFLSPFFTKSSANIFACVITVSTAFSCKSGG